MQAMDLGIHEHLFLQERNTNSLSIHAAAPQPCTAPVRYFCGRRDPHLLRNEVIPLVHGDKEELKVNEPGRFILSVNRAHKP